jgi:hypothetical protein
MQRNTTSTRFGRRALLLTLLLSTLPRLLRILLNFLNEYVFYGNLNYDEALVSTVTVAADFLGTVSLFAGLAAVIYMAFIGGVRKGGEWVFALIAGYGLSVLILSLSPDIGLGAVLFSLSTVAILLAILLWMKKGRAVAVAVAVTFFLTVIGGTQKSKTTNTFDTYKRLTKKTAAIGSSSFVKNFTYTKTRVTNVADQVCGVNIGTNSYTYDDLGRIKSDNYTAQSMTEQYKRYTYDQYGQLVREDNQALAKTFVYAYNNNGNITSVKAYAYTTGTIEWE